MIQRATPCVLVLVLAGSASARQWVAKRLQVESTLTSRVGALLPGQLAPCIGGYGGSAGISSVAAGSIWDDATGRTLPVVWWGLATSFQALDAGPGEVTAVGPDAWAGMSGGHAVIWFRFLGRVDLAPPGALLSQVQGAAPNMQAGWIAYGLSSSTRAALWRDTAASFIDLHPTGAVRSRACATDGVRQGGYVVWPGQGAHAAIWDGGPATFVDLHPGGQESEILGMAMDASLGVQVGDVLTAGSERHAAVWHGTVESFADYNPPSWNSRFLATDGQRHAGQGGPGNALHAIAHLGGPEGWVDLHQFLPAGYSVSAATSVGVSSNGTINVGGYAIRDATGQREAFFWIPGAACYANCDQSTTPPILNVSDFVCFINKFAAGETYANCDCGQIPPPLNVMDFSCFLFKFANGCN